MIALQLLALILSGAGLGYGVAMYDAERHRLATGLNHKSRKLFRSAFFTLLTFGFCGWQLQAVQFGLVFLSAFYLVFDPAFNKHIGQNWLYLGTTAWFDRVWMRVGGGKVAFALELVVLAGLCWWVLTA